MADSVSGTPTPLAGIARIRQLLRNPISMIGLALAAVALGNSLFFFFLDLTSTRSSPYVGILAYMVAPAIMIFGLAVAAGGAFYYRRRAPEAAGHRAQYLRLDFS